MKLNYAFQDICQKEFQISFKKQKQKNNYESYEKKVLESSWLPTSDNDNPFKSVGILSWLTNLSFQFGRFILLSTSSARVYGNSSISEFSSFYHGGTEPPATGRRVVLNNFFQMRNTLISFFVMNIATRRVYLHHFLIRCRSIKLTGLFNLFISKACYIRNNKTKKEEI